MSSLLAVIPGTSTRTPIGLDLGAAGLRAVQLRKDRGAFVVVAANEYVRPSVDQRHPDGSTPDDPPPCSTVPTAREILACTDAAGFRGRRASIAVSAPDVEFHALDVPRDILQGDPARLEQTIRTEIERLSTRAHGPEPRNAPPSDPADSLEASCWPIPAGAGSKTTAIGVGVRSSVVTRAAQACSAARLVCLRIDTAATALAGFGRLLRSWPPGLVWGVLDVGLRESRLVLCAENEPVLVRRIGTGGAEWTRQIAETLGVSLRAAELHKRDAGIAPSAARDATADPNRDELATLMFGVLRSELSDLAAEAKRSYEYALRCYPGKKAGDLVLTGGGSRLRHLDRFLSDTLGIHVAQACDYLGGEGCRIVWPRRDRAALATFAAAIGTVAGD